jgi:hypothetical protein
LRMRAKRAATTPSAQAGCLSIFCARGRWAAERADACAVSVCGGTRWAVARPRIAQTCEMRRSSGLQMRVSVAAHPVAGVLEGGEGRFLLHGRGESVAQRLHGGRRHLARQHRRAVRRRERHGDLARARDWRRGAAL